MPKLLFQSDLNLGQPILLPSPHYFCTVKGAKMIITENREKVKRKALSLINKGDNDLSKPEKKFMLEMMMGLEI